MRWLYSQNLSRMENDSLVSQILGTVPDGTVPFCVWKTTRPKLWDAFEIVDYMLTGPLLALLILAGVLSGCLCLMTFWHGYKKLQLYIYLMTLASWDIFYLFTSIYLYCLPTFIYHEIVSFGPLVVASPAVYYLGAVARIGCVWTVVIIAFERYVALCHPFKFEAWSNSQRRLRCVFVGVALCAFFYCLPRYFELRSEFCFEITELSYVSRLQVTSMRHSFAYWLFYRVLGGLLLYSAGPFLTLVILTVKIGVEISKSTKRFTAATPSELVAFNESSVERQDQASEACGKSDRCRSSCGDQTADIVRSLRSSKRQSAATLSANNNSSEKRLNHWMHVAMMGKFLLCHSYPVLLDTWELIDPSVVHDRLFAKRWHMMSHVSLFLVVLNSSCNFFIYFATSERFRADCARALRRTYGVGRFFKKRRDYP